MLKSTVALMALLISSGCMTPRQQPPISLLEEAEALRPKIPLIYKRECPDLILIERFYSGQAISAILEDPELSERDKQSKLHKMVLDVHALNAQIYADCALRVHALIQQINSRGL